MGLNGLRNDHKRKTENRVLFGEILFVVQAEPNHAVGKKWVMNRNENKRKVFFSYIYRYPKKTSASLAAKPVYYHRDQKSRR